MIGEERERGRVRVSAGAGAALVAQVTGWTGDVNNVSFTSEQTAPTMSLAGADSGADSGQGDGREDLGGNRGSIMGLRVADWALATQILSKMG